MFQYLFHLTQQTKSKQLLFYINLQTILIEWQSSVLSPTKLSDSQDSACDVDFDEENSEDGFLDAMVHEHEDKVKHRKKIAHFHWSIPALIDACRKWWQ